MAVLQEFIHRLEVGGGLRWFGRYFYITVGALAVLVLFAGYNLRAYRNFSSMEAMDAAQLGRNIAEGRGYTTRFVRPFSMYLLSQAPASAPAPGSGARSGPSRILGEHPDISNPPVYPVVLAGLMATLPFHYQAENTNWFWSVPGRSSDGADTPSKPRIFWRYQPEFIICLFNQALFGLCIALTFFIARRLFDPTIAWVSAILVLGTELLWRFSVSGLSTMLLITLILGLFWVLMRLDRHVEEDRPLWQLLLFAAAAGLLAGVGGLTRYSLAWLILPLLAWLALFGGKARWLLALSAFAAFLLVLSPWVIRNLSLSGTPFGTASYALLEGTPLFPEFRLERSLEPRFDGTVSTLSLMTHKSVTHTRQMVGTDLPQLGGTWLSAFFLVGLLVGYRKGRVRRLRYFLVGCLATLALVQALGRTHISEAWPVLNTENLLVLLAPLVIMYGTSLFFLLLETVEFAVREVRYAAIGLFVLAASLPLLLALMPPKTLPLAWPPYHPAIVQTAAGWMKPNELTMSDQPWALAWYGNVQSAWLTLNCGNDYLTLNDYRKPIQLLFLSRPTIDLHLYSDFIQAGRNSWGEFILQASLMRKVPDRFPLQVTAPNWSPEFLVLTDYERWRTKSSGRSIEPATP